MMPRARAAAREVLESTYEDIETSSSEEEDFVLAFENLTVEDLRHGTTLIYPIVVRLVLISLCSI